MPARGLIAWSQTDLARGSGVLEKTVADFERSARVHYARTLEGLCAALESAGVEFIDENGGGPGVRLRKAQES
jgi:hypothetical protein